MTKQPEMWEGCFILGGKNMFLLALPCFEGLEVSNVACGAKGILGLDGLDGCAGLDGLGGLGGPRKLCVNLQKFKKKL